MESRVENCEPDRLAELMDAGTVAPAAPLSEGAGTVVGRYKLLQLIGEGGFGAVFMAEQEHPVRRRVALKIIKLGMDTKQVVARFEAERQALAMMDHPHIAKVFDADATETGRPYFVMELVRGSPINEYCDKNALSPRDRLELFVQVCQAVQHAHTKGIIHRDLKPSNVLVTTCDGRRVPTVIDFGIAKATQARLTEKTLFTEFRQLIGTPQYMSPEQADSDGTDVDTRSDIYSLGVLLYELLTGSTPFDPQELRSAAYAEIQRIIREVEPPTPSRRLSALGDGLSQVAARRKTEPQSLGQLIRGELDWIVMKAIEKNRSRRYDSAAALAADVERHLNDEPVLARPTDAFYRLRKAARRHRLSLVVTAAVLVALVAGLITALLGLAHARRSRDLALAAEARAERDAETARRASAFLRSVLSARNFQGGGFDITPAWVLDEAARRLEQGELESDKNLEADVHLTLATDYMSLGDYRAAKAHLDRAAALRKGSFTEKANRAALRAAIRAWEQRVENAIQEKSKEIMASGEGKPDRLELLFDRAGMYMSVGRFNEANADLEKVISGFEMSDPHPYLYYSRGEYIYYCRACLSAYLGDLTTYHETCETMYARFRESMNLSTLEQVAKTCLLLPNGTGGDPQLMLPLVQGVALHDDELSAWFNLTRSLAMYRLGRYGDCIDCATAALRANATDYRARTPTANLLLAMAHFRLGHSREAFAAIERAELRAERDLPKLGDGDLNISGSENWLIYHTLHREAEGLTGGAPSTMPAEGRKPAVLRR